MIKVSFVIKRGLIRSFTVEGHSGFDEQGSDIVCAAVSSAAYMTVNTITDVLNLRPALKAKDGYMTIKLSSKQSEKAQAVLAGFRLHLTELGKIYKENITVKISEV